LARLLVAAPGATGGGSDLEPDAAAPHSGMQTGSKQQVLTQQK
jgi:hypothetical protein